MIFSRCPLRVSLAGGSTDLQSFIDRYGEGGVINFSPNIYTYIGLYEDKLGENVQSENYVINYSEKEVVSDVASIKNDVARSVLEHFGCPPVTSWFTSDVYSAGSGLGSSSSYLNAYIGAVTTYSDISMSRFEICSLAHRLEQKFNPMTGLQDPFGCGIGGFNRMHFDKMGNVHVEKISDDLFKQFDLYLLHTGISRSSTAVLKTVDLEKCLPLLGVVDEMYDSIVNKKYGDFLRLINDGWIIKKATSSSIMSNDELTRIDNALLEDRYVLAHRLLGAGNGGYFLLFVEKDFEISRISYKFKQKFLKINLCEDGIMSERVFNNDKV